MKPYSGLIEGFFGREWSWSDRRHYADFLARRGFDFYIYAPKGDRFLRHAWNEDWPEETWQELAALRQTYREKGVAFGLGLSPFDVQQNYDQAARDALKVKTRRLNQLEPEILCILFDDMKGDVADLARIQTDMAHLIAETSTSERKIVCPSYYSDDPVLERVFGEAPKNYLEDLGTGLDSSLDIFWTGPLVCSTEYPKEHLEDVGRRLGRKPFLWDNYPVNDGAKKCNHLHLKAFRPHDGADLVSGHAINPMNQAWLSKLSLLTFQASFRSGYDPNQALLEALKEEGCPSELGSRLAVDIPDFHDRGLLEISASDLAELYSNLPPHPYREETVEWLCGKYEFDPACLTD